MVQLVGKEEALRLNTFREIVPAVGLGSTMKIMTSAMRRLGNLRKNLGIPITGNDFRLAALRNTHRGRRAFVIGNGPSLSVDDLDRLRGEISFACNKIYLAYYSTSWRPTYYTVYDVLVARNNRDEINKVVQHKIFGAAVAKEFSGDRSITYVTNLSLPSTEEGVPLEFSENLLLGAYGGWTTIYTQLQLAYFMGIREVYLIGLDFHFDLAPSTNTKTELGEPVLRSSGEVNHFHPDYRAPGETWTLPELGLQRRAFQAARKAFEKSGGMLCNASRKTALDVLPLVDFDDLFPPSNNPPS